MHIELMAIQHFLKRWLHTPDAPICEISLCHGETRNRPYSEDDISMSSLVNRFCSGLFICLT
jgi:hypothetical protein